MESRTTPSLSFSMPGWMSATVRGRRGGGQIWLTVRRTGGFFFHRVRSWQGVLASGILGVTGSRPAGWIQRASQVGGRCGTRMGPLPVPGRTTRTPGWTPDAGLPPERGAPTSRSPLVARSTKTYIIPSGS